MPKVITLMKKTTKSIKLLGNYESADSLMNWEEQEVRKNLDHKEILDPTMD